jgi:hypothetical protein
MRTPDSDETQGTGTQGGEGTAAADTVDGDASRLADGFGASGPSDDGLGGGDNAFGTGSSDDGEGSPFDEAFASQDPSFLQSDAGESGEFGESGDPAGGELSAFEFEPDYVPDSDTDWDVTGDGVVDHHDAHEAMTGFQDFHVDDADSHGHAQNEAFFDHE